MTGAALESSVRGASIAVLPLHSGIPRVGWQTDAASTDLWLPLRCTETVVAALVAHALAQVAPTRLRRLTARRRLREAGVRVSDFRRDRRTCRRGTA